MQQEFSSEMLDLLNQEPSMCLFLDQGTIGEFRLRIA